MDLETTSIASVRRYLNEPVSTGEFFPVCMTLANDLPAFADAE